MMDTLKLFVWEDVLRNYTSGMAVILAHDEVEAREIMKRDFPNYVAKQLDFSACEIVTEPKGFYVYGGE